VDRYPALKPILIDSGVYSNLCPKNDTTTATTTMDDVLLFSASNVVFGDHHVKNETRLPECDKQNLRLNLIAIVAMTLANGLAILCGLIVDLCNPRIVWVGSSLVWGVCYLLFGLSGPNFPMYIPTGAVATLMGALMFLCSLKLASYARSPLVATMIVSILTAMWDLSSLNAWIFNVLYFHTNLTLRHLFCWFSVFAVPSAIYGILHAPFGFELNKTDVTDESEEQKLIGEAKEEDKGFFDRMKQFISELVSSILSLEILSIYLSLAMSILSMYFYLSTVSDQLRNFTSSTKQIQRLIFGLSIILPLVGTVASVVLGRIKGALGPELAFLLLTVLNAIWTTTSLIPVANLQYFTFIVCVSWRIAVFVFASDHIIGRYPISCSFTVYATGLTIAGLFSLTASIWNTIVEKHLNGNFFYVNLVIGILNVAASAIATLGITFAERRRRAERNDGSVQ
jgi:hypothetical protein